MVPAATSRPSELIATLVTPALTPFELSAVTRTFDDLSVISKILTVPSIDPEMIDLPSGENTRELTRWVWPRNTSEIRVLAILQI